MTTQELGLTMLNKDSDSPGGYDFWLSTSTTNNILNEADSLEQRPDNGMLKIHFVSGMEFLLDFRGLAVFDEGKTPVFTRVVAINGHTLLRGKDAMLF